MASPYLSNAISQYSTSRASTAAATFLRRCRIASISTASVQRRSIQSYTGAPRTTADCHAFKERRVQRSNRRSRPQPHRFFSSSSCRPATVVLQNPRTDEDGAEMSILISDRAAKRLSQITSKNNLPPQHLRVTVTSGGCHGFQYLMSLEPAEKIDGDEDTIFAAEEVGDGQAMVVLDEPSLELLKGSTIDYTTELIGSQFKIVGNPRAKSSCGCGTSFDIE